MSKISKKTMIVHKNIKTQIIEHNMNYSLYNNIATKENRIYQRENKTMKKLNKPKNHKLIFKCLIIIELILQILSRNIFNIFEFNLSKVTLKIKGKGVKYILGYYPEDEAFTFPMINFPETVKINGASISPNYSYYFDQEDNNVELIWNNEINKCKSMFRKCSDITEIDLTGFNSSQVKDTSHMFSYCSSLTSIKFGGFITSQVKTMRSMFNY